MVFCPALSNTPIIITSTQVFNEINSKYNDEYNKLQLVNLIPSYLTPILQSSLKDHNPLTSPRKISSLFSSWASSLPHPRVLLPLFLSHVNPALNRTIMNGWNCEVDSSDAVVAIYADFTTLLGRGATDFLLDNTIAPKLVRGVEDWDPTDAR